MPEKAVIAYFKTPGAAKKAKDKLEGIAEEIQIDEFSRFTDDGIEQFMSPLTSQIENQTSMTLGLQDDSPDTRILLGADVNNSGLSDGDQAVKGYNFILTAITDENTQQDAVEIIRQSGGWV